MALGDQGIYLGGDTVRRLQFYRLVNRTTTTGQKEVKSNTVRVDCDVQPGSGKSLNTRLATLYTQCWYVIVNGTAGIKRNDRALIDETEAIVVDVNAWGSHTELFMCGH